MSYSGEEYDEGYDEYDYGEYYGDDGYFDSDSDSSSDEEEQQAPTKFSKSIQDPGGTWRFETEQERDERYAKMTPEERQAQELEDRALTILTREPRGCICENYSLEGYIAHKQEKRARKRARERQEREQALAASNEGKEKSTDQSNGRQGEQAGGGSMPRQVHA
ncbi:hypothetical protein D9611_008793 [Ephemerocybe angulata]|uniref:Uncharacterized protein n=1 Tax=Ephemerocybe angulata TaxID=980116 RepID=A0A8H5CBQ3_9AGAR|nr:hypothetical protein D9611_008793 [Tulosesus angulatus]